MINSRYFNNKTFTLTLALAVVLVGAGWLASAYATSGTHRLTTARRHQVAAPSIVAYGVVRPLCGTCEPPTGFTPLAVSRNVSLGTLKGNAPSGVWCFTVPIARGNQVAVVATVEGGEPTELPGSHPPTVAQVQWVRGTNDCQTGNVEIHTFRYPSGGQEYRELTAGGNIAFSFAVLD